MSGEAATRYRADVIVLANPEPRSVIRVKDVHGYIVGYFASVQELVRRIDLAEVTLGRYTQCDDTCTVDCGHCKGRGRPHE